MTDWRAVSEVAERQHLLIATWQLRYLGVSSTALEDRVKAHGWRRVHRAVTALPGTATSLQSQAAAVLAYSRPAHGNARVDQLLLRGLDTVAAVTYAALGAGQLLCGPSALHLYGLLPPPAVPWVRLPRNAGTAGRPDIRVRYGTTPSETVWLEGLPTTDVEQGIIDLPGCTGHHPRQVRASLTRVIADADARRLTTLDLVSDRLDQIGRGPGLRLCRDVITDLRGELSHSTTEGVARAIVGKVLAAYGLELYPRPYPVEAGGRIVGEADLAVLVLRLDIEVDGPHHDLPAQVRKDRLRDRDLRHAHWEVERFPVALIDDSPDEFARRVDEVVRDRMKQLSYVPFAAGAAKST